MASYQTLGPDLRAGLIAPVYLILVLLGEGLLRWPINDADYHSRAADLTRIGGNRVCIIVCTVMDSL